MSGPEKMANMQAMVSSALARLEPLFKHAKLTFVARNTNPDLDADVIVSNDPDHAAVAKVLLEHERRAMRPSRRREALLAAWNRELDFLRKDLVDELRAHWIANDDRWAPWRPEDERERFTGWTERDYQNRRDREDHNSLARAFVSRLRALDAARSGELAQASGLAPSSGGAS